jgi:hypothetical protein
MDEHGRWLRWTAVLLLIAAVIAISLTAAGTFDPRPNGTEQWQRLLPAETIPAHSRRLVWLDQPLPDQAYSVRLTAAYRSGELDIGYGLVLGTNNEYLAAAVSPLGYVAIWQATSKQLPLNSNRSQPSAFRIQNSAFIIPWQPWPHVRTGAGANELWIDVDRSGDSTYERITVRSNREWLWSGEVEMLEGQIGLWVESFGEAAVVNFQRLQLFNE